MKVAVILDPAFDGNAADAVWIVDTPANQQWFASHLPSIESNSSIFPMGHYPSVAAAAVYMIWNAQDHHPLWNEIEAVGVDLTPEIIADLQADGALAETRTGFSLTRA